GHGPGTGAPEMVPAELILAEYEVRRRFGAPEEPSAFVKRFPSRSEEVRHLFVDEGMDTLPIRWPPAAHRTGPEVRSSVPPFSASAGQQLGGNDPEQTRRAFRSSL